ncbi:unnamed protein product [Arctogadus glacialis]
MKAEKEKKEEKPYDWVSLGTAKGTVSVHLSTHDEPKWIQGDVGWEGEDLRQVIHCAGEGTVAVTGEAGEPDV